MFSIREKNKQMLYNELYKMIKWIIDSIILALNKWESKERIITDLEQILINFKIQYKIKDE